jgi:hypothetical protein
MTPKIVLGAIALVAAYALARNLPDIRRYIRIKRM